MDKREALFHVFSIVCKCDAANDCKSCLYYGDKENPCLVQFALDAGASHDKAALQRIAELWEDVVDKEKDNKKPSVPLKNVEVKTTFYAKAPISAEELDKRIKELLPQKLALEPLPKEDRAIKMPESSKPDNVNRPKHYCKGGVESIEFVKAAVSNLSGFEAVCVANIIKYMWRYKEKNGLEDVMKAAKYLEWLQEEVGKNANKA